MRKTAYPFYFAAAVTAALVQPATVNATPADVNTLTDVRFDRTDEALTFTFTGDGAISPEALSASSEGSVLALRLDQTMTRRRWLTVSDPLVKRVLLHPTRTGDTAANLRIRLNAPVGADILENILVQQDGDRVRAMIPRTRAVAQRWAAAVGDAPSNAIVEAAPRGATSEAPGPRAVAAGEPAAVAGGAESGPGTGSSGRPAVELAAAPATAGSSSALAVPTLSESSPPEVEVAEGSGAGPGLVDERLVPLEDAEEQTMVTQALSSPSDEGPGAGVLLMALLFLGGSGVFCWRKLKSRVAGTGGGPLIRPLGSHLLGPKQSLVLMDVAGEMVLLGTTDKGVRMLTKIDPRVAVGFGADGEAPEGVGIEEAEAAVPVGFAERLGRAFAVARSLSRNASAEAHEDEVATDPVERSFFDREEEALREAAEEDALSALCEAVEDRTPAATQVSRSRTGARPVARPATARPVTARPAAQRVTPETAAVRGSLAAPTDRTTGAPDRETLTHNLLQKIRRLQSA